MKPKQWLFDNGHIDAIKQGRISAVNKGIIEAALLANPNLHIDGFTVSKPSAVTDKPTVERVSSETGMVDVPDMVRDPRDWEAFDDTGKRFDIGIKGVCENCRSSVTYCRCKYSVLRVDNDRVSVVTFKPTRKGTS